MVAIPAAFLITLKYSIYEYCCHSCSNFKKTLYITNPKLAVLSKMKIEDNFATFLTACFVLEDTGCQKF